MSPTPPLLWLDPERHAHFTDWLTHIAVAQQLNPETLSLASADASFRRYLRIQTTSGESRIIMDAPPDKENCKPFVQVAQLMQDAGLNAPKVLAWDEPRGFMLLTDLGQQTMMQFMHTQGLVPNHAWAQDNPEPFLPLYRQAVDVLIKWQLASKPGVLPAYDDALLSRELQLFPDWYWRAHKGLDCTSPEHSEKAQVLQEAFALIKSRNLSSPSVYVHRDFMARNLMVQRNAQGQTSLGVLDFQDAVYGPITYDIASLMRDAFLTWDEEFVMDVTIRYWEKAKKAGLITNGAWGDWENDFGSFYAAVEWMGLQRHLKVAGIFARLSLRDDKPQYLADTPRFIAYIRHASNRYNALRPLLRLVEEVEGMATPDVFQFGR
jgi:N-acetylmuramate 1-kinase